MKTTFGALVELVDGIARDNARETEGVRSAETLAGRAMVLASAESVIDSLNGREWVNYRPYVTKPITDATARKLQAHFRKEYT